MIDAVDMSMLSLLMVVIGLFGCMILLESEKQYARFAKWWGVVWIAPPMFNLWVFYVLS